MTRLERDAVLVYATLKAGGVALVPTDVGYGLVAMEEPAVRRIYALKGRPATKPCVTVANAAIVEQVAQPIDGATREWLAEVTRLAPLAIVTRLAQSALIDAMSPYVRGQATHDGTIALFYSAGRLVERVAELALAEGKVVLGSSANLSGTGNNYAFADVPDVMREDADLVLDRGPAWYANEQRLATTMLDLTSGRFLRKGIQYAQIAESWAAHVTDSVSVAPSRSVNPHLCGSVEPLVG
jgi:tRNA A37 threonylcarbamoyladenosine synthetase subunit TsaC/SUA5/YrdC